MSKRKSGRNIHGILLLDKGIGISSNRALQEVRRLLNANKAGHTGSLDPLATGLLPLCFGEATKVSAMMLADDKRYRVVIQLGVATSTGDSEGSVIERNSVPPLSEESIRHCLTTFTGDIEQIPPMFSALKHNGKKLYELARAGMTIERRARPVTIHELKLVDFDRETLTLEVYCSKGTYIRSLAQDIGRYFGCGGTVTVLRRLQSGQFRIDNAHTLEELKAMDEQRLFDLLINVDKPLEKMPSLHLNDQQAIRIQQGQALFVSHSSEGKVRLYHASLFLGLGEMLMDGKLVPVKMFNLTG